MIIKTVDYNDAEQVIHEKYVDQWKELEGVLKQMLLNLKASDQAGKVGSLIFNPVGTNEAIKKGLKVYGWLSNISIPKRYDFLGLHVDFGIGGLIVEAQFSNYPFLLNNLIRSELLYKAGVKIGSKPCEALIVITKSRMFPASNSTLYFEQAQNQIDELARNKVFDIPIRLVGLFENLDTKTTALLSEYDEKRYSRTVIQEVEIDCEINEPKHARSRCVIKRL